MSENNKSTGRSPSEGGKNTQNISKRYDIPQRPMTDPSFGLSAGQVAERIELGEVNTPVKSPVKTVKQIIIGNTCTYFNFIFLTIAVALIACRSFNHLMFLPIIAANTVIGIVQELRSKKVLDNLTLLSTPRSSVIRDGQEIGRAHV